MPVQTIQTYMNGALRQRQHCDEHCETGRQNQFSDWCTLIKYEVGAYFQYLFFNRGGCRAVTPICQEFGIIWNFRSSLGLDCRQVVPKYISRCDEGIGWSIGPHDGIVTVASGVEKQYAEKLVLHISPYTREVDFDRN